MNAAKAYRKLKEVEATKFSNRLMLLRLELQKSQKKIEETERRTASILEHKQQIEARNRAKLEEMQRKQEEQQMAQQINQISRTRMAIIRRTKVKTVQEHKKEEAAAVISARRAHYDAIERQKMEQMQKAMAVKNFVKATLETGKEARKRDALLKREAARKAFADRVKLEAQKSKEAEEKLAIMEAEELKLIKLLEATQEYQKGAYQNLEGALLSSRKSIDHAQEELKAVQSQTLSSRTHSRMRHHEVEAIAMATLPPVIRKKLGKEDEEEKEQSSTPTKKPKPTPRPPAAKKPTETAAGKTAKIAPKLKMTKTTTKPTTTEQKQEEKTEESKEQMSSDATTEPATTATTDPTAETPAVATTTSSDPNPTQSTPASTDPTSSSSAPESSTSADGSTIIATTEPTPSTEPTPAATTEAAADS